uniref:Uncharacterized protein n=1 Tax=Myotis myotis TaxID=51298 RepID=A0A7J7VID3_MYOMY|nr:hypothetical protein mMyoMyo1_008246 [Myotis myotis]
MPFSFMTQQHLCKYQVLSTPWYKSAFAFRPFLLFCFFKRINLVLLKCKPLFGFIVTVIGLTEAWNSCSSLYSRNSSTFLILLTTTTNIAIHIFAHVSCACQEFSWNYMARSWISRRKRRSS